MRRLYNLYTFILYPMNYGTYIYQKVNQISLWGTWQIKLNYLGVETTPNCQDTIFIGYYQSNL
jgi:Fe-S cluster biosynthesis and repair protein YggX